MVQLLCNFNPPKTLYYYLCVAVYTIGNEQGPDGHILCRRLFVEAIGTRLVPRRRGRRHTIVVVIGIHVPTATVSTG
jgi:hypothetical protein